MGNTNAHISVQPATADLLTQTAENRETSVDCLVREMLVLHTSAELQRATAELQQALQEDTSLERAGASVDRACPYCQYSGDVSLVDSFGEYSFCCCSNVYCLVDAFVWVKYR